MYYLLQAIYHLVNKIYNKLYIDDTLEMVFIGLRVCIAISIVHWCWMPWLEWMSETKQFVWFFMQSDIASFPTYCGKFNAVLFLCSFMYMMSALIVLFLIYVPVLIVMSVIAMFSEKIKSKLKNYFIRRYHKFWLTNKYWVLGESTIQR